MVKIIMTVPRALISGLMELRNIPNILTGTVWFWAVAQNRVAVISSKDMVKENSMPAKIAGVSNGRVTSLNVWTGLAPKDWAASSYSRLMPPNLAWTIKRT